MRSDVVLSVFVRLVFLGVVFFSCSQSAYCEGASDELASVPVFCKENKDLSSLKQIQLSLRQWKDDLAQWREQTSAMRNFFGKVYKHSRNAIGVVWVEGLSVSPLSVVLTAKEIVLSLRQSKAGATSEAKHIRLSHEQRGELACSYFKKDETIVVYVFLSVDK